MDFSLHNTASGRREKVYAADGKAVGFYCCGPTVYGPAHIGNFRTFLVQDLFRRVCEFSGLSVVHVRNVTDIDDKTIRESMACDESLNRFTARWREKFEADCGALNLLPPHQSPSAVEHIAEQIALIERLLEKGHAYRGEDRSVYFRVRSFDRYGELARIDPGALRDNADGRLNSDDEYSKDDVADFALWKARKPEDGENFWESPWGPGRPGWHLECSAMSMKYLGETFDVHAGGVDLTFPHHVNEIAQSECATGRTFARHWFHSAHLMVEGKKMSKSLGNLFTLADLVERGYHPMEVRWVLLSGHYRKTLNFTMDSLRAGRKALVRLAEAIRDCGGTGRTAGDPSLEGDWLAAWESLLEDLNVPRAMGHVMKEVSRCEKESGNWDDGAKERWAGSARFILEALGIDLPKWEETHDRPEADEEGPPPEILALAEQRQAARKAKDFGTADRLRDEIAAEGWTVKDSPDGFELVRDS